MDLKVVSANILIVNVTQLDFIKSKFKHKTVVSVDYGIIGQSVA